MQVREHVSLATFTTLGLGGRARLFVECATEEQVRAICDSVVQCLGDAPPELAQDLIVQGIHLVGGGGLLGSGDQR